jgi:hypothetical protein
MTNWVRRLRLWLAYHVMPSDCSLLDHLEDPRPPVEFGNTGIPRSEVDRIMDEWVDRGLIG